MDAKTQAIADTDTGTAGIITALLAGVALLFIAGVTQAAVVHAGEGV